MNNVVLLSFVIPLYNCEKYIIACLDSICRSNLEEAIYEIIVVDDGSRDHSLSFALDYAAQHANIKVITQNNAGASTARNRGLSEAVGRYIWFVDADDRVDTQFLDRLPKILQETKDNIEILCFNYTKDFADRTTIVDEFGATMLVGTEYLGANHSLYLWNKVYAREVLEGHCFLDSTKNLEDFLFNLQLIPALTQIFCIPEVGYYYNQTNEISTSHNQSKSNLQKISDDTVVVHQAVNQLINKLGTMQQRAVVIDILRWSLAGYMYSLAGYYSAGFTLKQIRLYEKLGFYPIKRSSHKRQNTFLLIANCKFVFVALVYIYHIFKKTEL